MQIYAAHDSLCNKVLSSWITANVVTGARGDLKGHSKIKICPACLDITDQSYILTLTHVLQV